MDELNGSIYRQTDHKERLEKLKDERDKRKKSYSKLTMLSMKFRRDMIECEQNGTETEEDEEE